MKFNATHCTAEVKRSLQLSFMLISMQAMEQKTKKKKRLKRLHLQDVKWG